MFDEYPCIIAHEYWRLYDLLNKGQSYGALLQIKDIFEVLLKFPTLIVASVIYNKKERPDEENKILVALLEKLLPLGAWERIAQTMCEKIYVNSNISYIQKSIVSIFDQYAIRDWRNKSIGHGALAFDNDEEFQQDIEIKLKLLRTHFQDCDTAYSNLIFYLLTERNEQILLHGKSKARNLNYPDSEVFIETDEFKQVLSPYIIFRDQGIYLFSTYFAWHKKTAILNYPDGERQTIHNQQLTSLYSTLSKRTSLKNLLSSIDDEVFPAFESEILDKVGVIDDFQQPTFLKRWLKKLFKKHSKGVFLLQMERGTGKTTFVMALNQRSMGKMNLENVTVKCYYVNNSYLYKIENFVSIVNSLMITDTNGKVAIHGSIPVLSAISSSKQEDFAKFLGFYQQTYYKIFQSKKLLFIIDGLDEIPKSTDSIFDFIPTPDMLDDNVYILFTCRSESEITSFTKKHLNILVLNNYHYGKEVPAHLHIPRGNKGYIILLRTYLEGQLPSRLSQEIEMILSISEYRFLYVKMLKELIKLSKVDSKIHFDIKLLFKDFLKNLHDEYGSRFYVEILKIFSILSTASKPITLNKLSGLIGEVKPTFKLLAYLVLLQGFLKIERSDMGDVFSLSYPEIAEIISQELDEMKKHKIMD